MSELAEEERALLTELGHEAWKLQRHHTGTEHLQRRLDEIQSELDQKNARALALEERLYLEEPAMRPAEADRCRAELRTLKQDLRRLQDRSTEDLLALGVALDQARHYDAGLNSYYDRVDALRRDLQAQRHESRGHRKAMVRSLPLVLVCIGGVAGVLFGIHYVLNRTMLGFHTAFTDAFDSRLPDWYQKSDSLVEIKATGGRLSIKGRESDQPYTFKSWLYQPVETPSFSFEARAWLVEGEGPFGMIFKYVGDDYYAFELDSQGRYRIRVYFQKKWREVTDWKSAPQVAGRRTWTTLMVVCLGSKIS
ncbi:MAG: hypothetical protein FJ278_25475, partial [Planctomycetes bacterium]|nr:hypothetical protein [Planctomycetota bacterium]